MKVKGLLLIKEVKRRRRKLFGDWVEPLKSKEEDNGPSLSISS